MKTLAILCNFLLGKLISTDWLNRLAVKTRPQGFGSSGTYLLCWQVATPCAVTMASLLQGLMSPAKPCVTLQEVFGLMVVKSRLLGLKPTSSFACGALELWKFLKNLFEVFGWIFFTFFFLVPDGSFFRYWFRMFFFSEHFVSDVVRCPMARSLRVAKWRLFVLLALQDKVSTYPAKVPIGRGTPWRGWGLKGWIFSNTETFGNILDVNHLHAEDAHMMIVDTSKKLIFNWNSIYLDILKRSWKASCCLFPWHRRIYQCHREYL